MILRKPMLLHRINHVWYNFALLVSIERDNSAERKYPGDTYYKFNFVGGTSFTVGLEKTNELIEKLRTANV